MVLHVGAGTVDGGCWRRRLHRFRQGSRPRRPVTVISRGGRLLNTRSLYRPIQTRPGRGCEAGDARKPAQDRPGALRTSRAATWAEVPTASQAPPGPCHTRQLPGWRRSGATGRASCPTAQSSSCPGRMAGDADWVTGRAPWPACRPRPSGSALGLRSSGSALRWADEEAASRHSRRVASAPAHGRHATGGHPARASPCRRKQLRTTRRELRTQVRASSR